MEHKFKVTSIITRVLLPTIVGGLLVYFGVLYISEPRITDAMQVILVATIFINATAFEFFIKKKTAENVFYVITVTILELLVFLKLSEDIQLFLLPFSILMIMTISDIENMNVPTWTLIFLPSYCIAPACW